MLILLELAFAGTIFWFAWGPLGAGKVVRGLLKDERAELQAQLDEAEDNLAELAADPAPDETSQMLKLHYEKEARTLRRRLARLDGREPPKKLT